MTTKKTKIRFRMVVSVTHDEFIDFDAKDFHEASDVAMAYVSGGGRSRETNKDITLRIRDEDAYGCSPNRRKRLKSLSGQMPEPEE